MNLINVLFLIVSLVLVGCADSDEIQGQKGSASNPNDEQVVSAQNSPHIGSSGQSEDESEEDERL